MNVNLVYQTLEYSFVVKVVSLQFPLAFLQLTGPSQVRLVGSSLPSYALLMATSGVTDCQRMHDAISTFPLRVANYCGPVSCGLLSASCSVQLDF